MPEKTGEVVRQTPARSPHSFIIRESALPGLILLMF